MFWVVRKIRNYFRARRLFASLKEQAEKVDCWRNYVNEERLYNQFYDYSKQLHNIKRSDYAEVKLEFVSVFSEETKNLVLAPQLYISQNVECCKKLKMISSLWKEDGVKYSYLQGNEVLFSGEGSFESCVREIKEYLKNGGNGKV